MTRRSASPSAATAGRRTRNSWCPTACASTSPPASARGAPRREAGGPTLFASYRAGLSRPRDRDRSDAASRSAGRVGSRPSGLPGGCQGHRRPGRLGQGAQRARAEHPVVPRRVGGSRAVEQDHADVQGRRRLPGRTTRAARMLHFGIREHAMAAIVNGLALSKLRAFGATFFIFSDYARPAIRLSALMELPSHLRVHARRHGRRRGRPHAPARRAPRVAARHARAGHAAAGRRQRGRGGVPLRACSSATSRPCSRSHGSRCRRSIGSIYASATGVARGAYVLADPPGGESRGDPHRLRQRAESGRRGPRASWSPRASARASSRCRRGRSSSSRPGVSRQRAAARREGARGDRAGLHVRLGAIRRQLRPRDRHEDVRGVGAAQGASGEIRLRARAASSRSAKELLGRQ